MATVWLYGFAFIFANFCLLFSSDFFSLSLVFVYLFCTTFKALVCHRFSKMSTQNCYSTGSSFSLKFWYLNYSGTYWKFYFPTNDFKYSEHVESDDEKKVRSISHLLWSNELFVDFRLAKIRIDNKGLNDIQFISSDTSLADTVSSIPNQIVPFFLLDFC